MTMVEKAARAMVVEAGFDPDERVHGAMTRLEAYIPVARAGIAAMVEPTEAMIDAVREIGGSQWAANAHATWPTMIDAALAETPAHD